MIGNALGGWVERPGAGWLWDCDVCLSVVEAWGPWCELYSKERNVLCRPLCKKWLREADSSGDGPLVNALCEYGRRRWGEDIDW
jgi:hypothetical protein